MSQYANIKDAFLHCDVDKLILEYCKIPDGESSKVTIERASAEVHAAMERIKQTQPEKAEKQNLLIVCKTFEENETDTTIVQRTASAKTTGSMPTVLLVLFYQMMFAIAASIAVCRMNLNSSAVTIDEH